MKKSVSICLFIIIIVANVFGDVKFKFIRDDIKTLIGKLNKKASPYPGFYSYSGDIVGDSYLGKGPSFNIGLNTGVLFVPDPFGFLPNDLKLKMLNKDELLEEIEDLAKRDRTQVIPTLYQAVNTLNAVPFPLWALTFNMGIYKGFQAGLKMSFFPVLDIKRNNLSVYFAAFNIGANLRYGLIRDHKWLPGMSVGFLFNYSLVRFNLGYTFKNFELNIAGGSTINIKLNPQITHNLDVISFGGEYWISKKFIFFRPFMGFRIMKNYMFTLSKSGGEAKLTDGNNVDQGTESLDYSLETINDATEFVWCNGFEIVLGPINLGIGLDYNIGLNTIIVNSGFKVQIDFYKPKKAKKSK